MSLPRLSNAFLRSAGAAAAAKAKSHSALRLPKYDRSRVKEGIVHFGVGGFHRAHLAMYCDQLLNKHKDDATALKWGICGVGLLSFDAGMRDALVPQDGLFTLVERSDAEGDNATVIGSINSYIFAPDSPEAVLAKIAHADTHIVSLTVTESGYYYRDSSDSLDDSHPNIAADIAAKQLTTPKTIFGYLLEGLKRRQAAGLKPFTVLSCDNIQGNGHLVEKMLLAFGEKRGEKELVKWLKQHATFPNSMVDRITPQTPKTFTKTVQEKFGVTDHWPVVCEPFTQWVIEDAFCDGRPRFEDVGVQFTSNVGGYEAIKLRMLNATHSSMGYLGQLGGLAYIHEVAQDPTFAIYLRTLLKEEVQPMLKPPADLVLEDYAKTVLGRFANSTIGDTCVRICQGGSGKFPKFILPTVVEQLTRADGQKPKIRMLSLATAAWLRFNTGVDEQGKTYPVEDVMAEQLTKAAKEGGVSPGPQFALPGIFAPELTSSPEFVRLVSEALKSLHEQGSLATLKQWVADTPYAVKNNAPSSKL